MLLSIFDRMDFWNKFTKYSDNYIHYSDLPLDVRFIIENKEYKEKTDGALTIREYNKNILIILDDDEEYDSEAYFRKLDEKGYEICKVIARIPSNLEKKLRG